MCVCVIVKLAVSLSSWFSLFFIVASLTASDPKGNEAFFFLRCGAFNGVHGTYFFFLGILLGRFASAEPRVENRLFVEHSNSSVH